MSSQARRRLLCLNQVFLNDKRVPIKDFSSYVDLYLKDKPDAVKIHEKINDRWEVCVSASEGQFSQVSFVNGICTLRGGTHVNMIADQLASCVPLPLATLAAWQCPLDARLDMASPTVLLRILPLRRGCLRSKLLEQINKKNKSAGVKPFQIKNQLMVFVNALIENPAFDSQVRAHPQP
jgi:DNA topoisomerase-2